MPKLQCLIFRLPPSTLSYTARYRNFGTATFYFTAFPYSLTFK